MLCRKDTHKICISAFESRHSQCQYCGIEEAPACVGQIDQVLCPVVVNPNVVQNTSEEISVKSQLAF